MAPDGAGDGRVEPNGNRSKSGQRTGLLVDWGGVLTTNLFDSFKAFCVRSGVEPQKLRESFRADTDFRELLVALEKGELGEEVFEARLAPLLGVQADGLIDGLFAGVHADEAMLEAVRRARAAGMRTGLISNSWGVHRYPLDLFAELFDGVVISGEEGMRKPSQRMYELGAERAGVAMTECVYVDDLPFNLEPAEKLGMATIHHTEAATTIPELERLLGVALQA
jgi:putative hydrolase of the HAD superfamily